MKRSIIILATTIALASCGGGADDTKDTAAQLDSLKGVRTELDKQIADLEAQILKDNPEEAVPVTIKKLSPENFESYIDVQAAVSGDENVMATPQAPGVVSQVHVKSGQRVSKGQVLATLDAASVEQQVKAQEAQLTLAKQYYEKLARLWQENIGSEIKVLEAKANYESAQKQYEALQAQRNMYRIISPITGTVDAVNVKVGDATAPGAFGIRVVSMSKLKVETTLGENYIGKVHTGDPVILEFSETGTAINSKLNYVSQSVDAISRAFNVEVWLGSRNDVRPNMSCKMKILSYKNDKALTIPVAAVQKTAEGEMVYIVADGKAKPVIVKTGRIANGNAEITEGLSAGDQVIIEGYAEVDNGRTVEIL